MNNIYLIDESIKTLDMENGGGHHRIYIKSLSHLSYTVPYINFQKFDSFKRHPLKFFLQRVKYLNNLPTDGDYCFLYLDSIYLFPHSFKKASNSHKLFGVLHWIPDSPYKKYFLKLTSKYFKAIIVHSLYLKEELNKIGINNCYVIDYPCFCSLDLSTIKDDISSKEIRLLCIGSSRYDKGLDIFAKSLYYLPKTLCDKITIYVAGKETDIKFNCIIDAASDNKIHIKTLNKILTDDEYWWYIKNATHLVLPYRREFKGNSGPLADGVFARKIIIGPREGNIGFLIKKYGLGFTFDQENSHSLASSIIDNIENFKYTNETYFSKISEKSFLQEFNKLFIKFSKE